MLEPMPDIDPEIQERLGAAMEALDHALGDYRRVLVELVEEGVSWEDLTDLTGTDIEEIHRDLAEHFRCTLLAKRFENLS